jgi:hypothetical protein
MQWWEFYYPRSNNIADFFMNLRGKCDNIQLYYNTSLSQEFTGPHWKKNNVEPHINNTTSPLADFVLFLLKNLVLSPVLQHTWWDGFSTLWCERIWNCSLSGNNHTMWHCIHDRLMHYWGTMVQFYMQNYWNRNTEINKSHCNEHILSAFFLTQLIQNKENGLIKGIFISFRYVKCKNLQYSLLLFSYNKLSCKCDFVWAHEEK